MKRVAIFAMAVIAMGLVAGAPRAFAQDTFKITFPFQIGNTKLPKGDYSVVKKDGANIALKQESSGKEFPVPFTERIPQPNPPVADAQLTFDVVGNFAPSYTDYVTDYLLAEVWLQGSDGYLVHVTKGAHKTQIVKGEKAK